MNSSRLTILPLIVVLAVGCAEDQSLTAVGVDSNEGVAKMELSMSFDANAKAKSESETGLTDLQIRMEEINQRLEEAGLALRIQKAEISLAKNAQADAASIIFTNDRSLRLNTRWVPSDPRRAADGDNITYVVDQSFAAANSSGGALNSEPAVDAAFATWDDLQCSNVDLVKRADTDPNPNFVLALFGLVDINTANPFAADITSTGFLPGFVFDLLAPGGSQFILGVTFTLIFVDGNGPTDIDGNGYADTGLKEIWYNNAFPWTDTGTGADVDIETVAFHENGHAMELDHFGKVHATFSPQGGVLHVSPRAAMNAFILGTLREPLGTDNAAYCGIFGAWPTPH
ncbi:MAG: hypothetical protein R3282_00850 [Rhodothermales bacterium]|nr:hypothetical protein [Rhodothermales bacterium]